MDYSYRARKKDGETEIGELSALSRQAAITELRSKGLTPVHLAEKTRPSLSAIGLTALLGHISLFDKLTFVKNLAVLIRAGVPAPRALKILSVQTTNRRFRDVLLDLSKNVEGGVSLSQSFAKYPEIFSGLYVSLAEVGEASGNLDANLDYLVTLLQRENELVRKTKGALTYPIVVIATLLLVGVLMFIFVLPKLTATFKDLNVQLPVMTRVLVAAVDLLSKNSFLSVVIVAVIFGGLAFFFRSSVGRIFSQKAAINLPIISGITKKINLARFTLTLSMLLKSGMQIVPSLAMTSRSLGNMYYSDAVTQAGNGVRVGISLSASLEKFSQLFPTLLTQMIKVGEEAGTVEEMLRQMGEYYETEVDQIMKNLSSIIEPILMLIIGAVVAVMALALIMPIYSISQAM